VAAGGVIPQLVVCYYTREPEVNKKDGAFLQAKPGPDLVLDLMSRGAQACTATIVHTES
jgi:hypothetical protein